MHRNFKEAEKGEGRFDCIAIYLVKSLTFEKFCSIYTKTGNAYSHGNFLILFVMFEISKFNIQVLKDFMSFETEQVKGHLMKSGSELKKKKIALLITEKNVMDLSWHRDQGLGKKMYVGKTNNTYFLQNFVIKTICIQKVQMN